MNWLRIRAVAVPYLFMAPFMVLFIAFLIAPLIYAFGLSLYRESLIGATRFVGIENYIRVFNDAKFWMGVVNMLYYGAFFIPVLIGLSLMLALIIDSPFIGRAGKSFFRIALFLPYAIPGVIAAVIWGYMYGPIFGPITQVTNLLGMDPLPLLADGWILLSIANIAIWELIGYKMIIVYAQLQTIPGELEEAGVLDGATDLQYASLVKVPLVAGAILLNAIFSIIGTLQLFNEPAILKVNAPGVIHEAYTPNLYARSLAFTAQDLGYAAAVSFVLAAIVAVISSLVIYLSTRSRTAG